MKKGITIKDVLIVGSLAAIGGITLWYFVYRVPGVRSIN